MKNKLIILLLIVTLYSCKKDFLNLVPETSLSSASFYQNTAQFQQALSGAYTNLRTIVHIGFYADEMRSDNTFFSIYFANRGLVSAEDLATFTDKSTSSAEPNSPGNRWGNDYSGIAKVNTILKRLTTADNVTQG
ncbi:MAG: RagB/SusD family nutrient uptake outer membrane protein, partial [Bacteroidota bacterium]|nr:RagB/SusD family nutrient uptake outer membrane protein [Bacteroidota bacterium]